MGRCGIAGGTLTFAVAMWMRGRFVLIGLVLCGSSHAQNGPVTPTGAMRNTLFNGQLAGLMQLDTLAAPGVYGIGPVEYLRGEVLLLDGTVFVSTVKEAGMSVERQSSVRAPFFVHQHVQHWSTVELPDSVVDLRKLDAFLTARYAAGGMPFAFLMQGCFTSVDVHILDVPMGAEMKGPDDAHRHNKDYYAGTRNMDVVGFFSTAHKAVFTHHDTNIHVHAITAERDWMGHVEALSFVAKRMSLQVALP